MLDCISGGRLVAGFPVGTSMDTNYCYGTIPGLTREKYREAHELIKRAWANARAVRLQWPLHQAALREHRGRRPIQQPHPPMHIPGGGSIETFDFCIDNTYSYSYLSFGGYIRGAGADAGLLGSRGRAQCARYVAVSRRDSRKPFASPIRTRRPSGCTRKHVSYFYNRCLHVYPGLRRCAGLSHHQDHPERASFRSTRRRPCSRSCRGKNWWTTAA